MISSYTFLVNVVTLRLTRADNLLAYTLPRLH